MENLEMTIEQSLVLIVLSVIGLIWLHRNPPIIQIDIPKKEVEEKTPERNLRYLQIKRYYGG
ncbi:TPA: hypothetical protein ACGO8M_002023 [Streptococcus suis]